ncbi:MAG: MarR family transcriptional regulator [Candidatus Rokubacteria bacterium]|nr:MarR family transcriptional regulator [Candidatus Rokubacteria bacterium]
MKLISTGAELRQTVQCLELYYRQGQSQKDIARALGVSAATVSRLLKRAYDDGLVRVELDLPRAPALETALVQRFGLRDAVVVTSGGRADVREELGGAAAAYFEKITAHGMRVGLSCGFTLYQTVRALRERRLRDLVLYPLSGESTLKLVDISPNTLVGMAAAKYRPHVTAYALPVHHLQSPRQLARERRRLLRDPEIRRIYAGAQDVDVALVGIGRIGESTPGFCALAEAYGVSVERLRQLGVVGEINYQPFDVEGRIVDRPELRPLIQRVLAVDGPHLQALSRRDDRWVVAVAGGAGKIEAVRGALRGRFMNVLVTDQDVAAGLIDGGAPGAPPAPRASGPD